MKFDRIILEVMCLGISNAFAEMGLLYGPAWSNSAGKTGVVQKGAVHSRLWSRGEAAGGQGRTRQIEG